MYRLHAAFFFSNASAKNYVELMRQNGEPIALADAANIQPAIMERRGIRDAALQASDRAGSIYPGNGAAMNVKAGS